MGPGRRERGWMGKVVRSELISLLILLRFEWGREWVYGLGVNIKHGLGDGSGWLRSTLVASWEVLHLLA